jgi:hypothetical protein
MIVTIKDHPALATFLRRAFPSYRKHKAIIHVTAGIELSGASWSGGSRSTYTGVTLHGTHVPLNYSTTPVEFGGKASPEVVLTPDFVILQAGTFAGKPSTVTIHALPETLATLGINLE